MRLDQVVEGLVGGTNQPSLLIVLIGYASDNIGFLEIHKSLNL